MPYTPPLDESLARGGRYPETDLDDCGVDDRHTSAVYALRLCQPADYEAMLRNWHERYDPSPPPEIDDLFHASESYYVGAAKDLLERIHEHLNTPNRSGVPMCAFPTHSVARVWPESGASLAFERESGRAYELRNELDDCSVWQR